VWRRDLDLPSNVEIVARDLVEERNIAWLLHYRDDSKRIKKQAEFRMSSPFTVVGGCGTVARIIEFASAKTCIVLRSS
jgi:hypothetical protein